MTEVRSENSFFTVGGTLSLDAVYVTRPADEQLFRTVLSSEFCNVLTARQIGKSSLMIRTMHRLQQEGVRTAAIDLTLIGTKIDADQWYFGLLSLIKDQLNLQVNVKDWWNDRAQQSAVQRFSDFIRDVTLEEIAEPVVIFVDEIDSTLSLPFADDFFAAIRAAYNARARDPIYKRLTFVLLGVARPADLVKNRSRTPYNVGVSIDLRDFTLDEARTFLPGLRAVSVGQAETVLERVLYWTGGHPYLTQKVCSEIAADNTGQWNSERIDGMVKRLFLSDDSRKESNLQYVNDRIRESRDREKLLRVYRQVIAGKPVIDEERDPIKSRLKLFGLLKTTAKDTLVVRNRIYESVFNSNWIRDTMPKLTSTRITVAAVAISLISLIVTGVIIYRQQNNEEILAQTFTEGFGNTQNAAVRMTNMAGLFRLGNGFAETARDLFFGLDTVQQIAMFAELSAAEQIGEDLQTVVEGLYTHFDNTEQHNSLLKAIAEDLGKIESAFPDSRILRAEIDAWLEGRVQFQAGNYSDAVEAYSRAVNFNGRNPAVFLDRASAYSRIERYNDALTDLARVIELNPERQSQVVGLIQSNPSMHDYLKNHQNAFPTLGIN